MTWWKTNKLRLIQNNLREIDADLDVDRLVGQLKEVQANTWMMNAGGIFAFYPSKLEYQYVTPYLKKDLLGEAVRKAHGNGLKFIARFDFSKAHESIFAKKPEWFYRTRDGREVNYFGIVHTCLNSYYQQEYSLQMIDEVLDRYPVDGIFFNMFGYQHWDYSGNHYGPCYCGNCKRRFQDWCGENLEEYDGPEHRLHQLYRQFQDFTSREILAKISDHVKAKHPGVAICTYHHHKVDIVRHESNTALTRPMPMWLYSASENVSAIENSWPDKQISNCCINAIDLTYRFTGVSAHEAEIRLYENIASGSGLDFCIIGIFDGYPDRANLETVRSAFAFHAKHEALYGDLRSMADVVLIKPDGGHGKTEYLGLYKMLKEAHILFDTVMQEAIESRAAELAHAKALILPGVPQLTEEQRRCLARLQQAGLHLLATGSALFQDKTSLQELFGAAFTGAAIDEPAAYLDVSDSAQFPSLRERDWIIAPRRFEFMDWEQEADLGMPFVSPALFGPPERSYGHQPSGRHGLATVRRGAGSGTYYPWQPGTLYLSHGFEDHKHAVTDVLLNRLSLAPRLRTGAPTCVELFLHRLPDGNVLLQLINLSGFNGTTFMKPLPLSGLAIELADLPLPLKAELLSSGQTIACTEAEADRSTGPLVALTVNLPGTYEAVLLRYANSNPNEEGGSPP